MKYDKFKKLVLAKLQDKLGNNAKSYTVHEYHSKLGTYLYVYPSAYADYLEGQADYDMVSSLIILNTQVLKDNFGLFNILRNITEEL